MSLSIRRHVLIALLVLSALTVSCALRGVQPRAPKVAVVLGAGASRGFAHVGVLKVLEANSIPIDMIVGTSAGSFVGSLYAYGYSAFELQQISFDLQRADIIDYGIPDKGFIKGDGIAEFINRKVLNTPVEGLKIPFFAVATDMQDGTEAVFSRGDTGTAVRASSAIPGVFRPVDIDGRLYADGGIVSPVAVDAARRLGADIIIAVDISADVDSSQPEGTIDMILKAITIMHSQIASLQLSRADVVIRPAVGYIGPGDFTKRHEAVLEGEKAAQEALPEIQRLLAHLERH